MWKTIEGFCDYKISDEGQIVSLKNNQEKLLHPHFDSRKKYLIIGLCNNGSVKSLLVHRLVAETFLGKRKKGYEVNHKNLNKTDNRVDNLEWVTRKENMRHAKLNGVMKNPPTLKGKFGKEHNRSIAYVVRAPNGLESIYYSGREFKRITGLDNTNLTWASLHAKNKLPHEFKKGKLKGWILIETFNPRKPHFEIKDWKKKVKEI